MSNIEPIGKKLLVRCAPEKKEVGGILLPDRRIQPQEQVEAEVIKVGNKVDLDGVVVGSKILIWPRMGKKIKVGDEDLLLLPATEEAVLAIIPD